MTIIFSENFEDYGSSPDQKVQIEIEKSKVTFKLSNGPNTVSYDITPPSDGQWYQVSQILMLDDKGDLYAAEPPKIEPHNPSKSVKCPECEKVFSEHRIDHHRATVHNIR